MTVECPVCNTSFPVDPKKVPEGGVHARCSVCSEVFFVEEQVLEVEATPSHVPDTEQDVGIGVEIPEAEVLEEELEPAFEAPEALVVEEEAETEKMEGPFELPPIAEEGLGSEFEMPDVVMEDRTFEEGTPTFGDGEATFSMDSPALDSLVDASEEDTPTFGDPSPTIDFSGFPTEDVAAPPGDEVEPGEEATDELGEEAEPSFEMPVVEAAEGPPYSFEAPPVVEAERELYGFESTETIEHVPAPPFEGPEPSFEAPEVEEEVQEPTLPLPTPHFGRRDPKEKAQRLARVLVSDIILYNPDRHQRAVEQGSLKEEFEDEIQKSWNEYLDQVGEELANSTNFFNDALNEILAKDQDLF